MFDKASARYLLRCVLVGVGAFVSVWATDDLKAAAIAGISAALAYAGLGAAIPAVEPGVGVKRAIDVQATHSVTSSSGMTSSTVEGIPR